MAKSRTTFVSLRLDAELVERLDELAEREGLTRTAVIERLARREFDALRLVGKLSFLMKHVGQFPLTELEGDPMVEWLLAGPPVFGNRLACQRGWVQVLDDDPPRSSQTSGKSSPSSRRGLRR